MCAAAARLASFRCYRALAIGRGHISGGGGSASKIEDQVGRSGGRVSGNE